MGILNTEFPEHLKKLTTAIEHIGHARDESRLINALVVDDSTANAKLLALQLTELGHSVSKAESGREAIQKVAEESFQIIFMDIQMPDMNGVEATSAYSGEREHSIRPS